MLVHRMVGESSIVLSSGSKNSHDALRFWSNFENGSGSFSFMEVSVFSWQLNICFPLKGKTFSQPCLVSHRVLLERPNSQQLSRLSAYERTNIPWENTVCLSPNSLIRRPMKEQTQTTLTMPDSGLKKHKSTHQPDLGILPCCVACGVLVPCPGIKSIREFSSESTES